MTHPKRLTYGDNADRQGPITDMSAPQRDVLAAVAAHRTTDSADIREILTSSGSSITYSTLIHHLESLTDADLIAKHAGEHGTQNQYQITRDGLRTLTTHRDWLDECLSDAEPIEEDNR